MKKSKSTEPRDRFSELPDSLILEILSLLPMRDVVRTTILSKRWKDLWTTISCLDFKDRENNLVRFVDFVNRALILWRGTKILKFNIVPYFSQEIFISYRNVDSWLRFAIKNEVEELYVDLLNSWDGSAGWPIIEYFAPQRLYSCLSIRKLSLIGCNLKIHGNVQWNQLKCLTIEGVCLTEEAIDRVLSGTPRLEVLILCLMESNENLNIRSSSLKTLTIEKYDEEVDEIVLTIWAPNVETLEILGVLNIKYVLMNVSSLTKATVAFDYLTPEYYDDGVYPGYKLIEDMLGQVYHSTRHAEKVTLSSWFIKMLVEMKKKDMLATLSNVKFLKLYAPKIDEIVGLLEIFPKLTMLVLEDRTPWARGYEDIFEIFLDIREPSVTKIDTENSESETDFPKSCLLHLTTVEIAWPNSDNSIFPIIEYLLKYASSLERLVFRVKEREPLKPETLLSAAEKLLRMPRSSPTAEVILFKNDRR